MIPKRRTEIVGRTLGDASPHRKLASLHRDLATPHRDMSAGRSEKRACQHELNPINSDRNIVPNCGEDLFIFIFLVFT